MGRRKQRHESHVRLYRHELECEAYRSLSPVGRALLVEFRALYDGKENRVYMSIREIMRRLNIGQRQAQRARDELIDRGFIRVLTPGTFNRKCRHATEYALTHEPLDGHDRPPKDFMRWSQKNTVALTATVGSTHDYRGGAVNDKNRTRGSSDDYRQGQNSQPLGSTHGYTDKLPPQGADNWLAAHGGWPVMLRPSLGEPKQVAYVLNTCCIVCGVWTTAGGYEFDGARHSCDRTSKADYERRVACAGETAAAAA